ncbi:MAG: hypothetical protein ABW250_24940, partial [Pyrinomonadaceae bacterium]
MISENGGPVFLITYHSSLPRVNAGGRARVFIGVGGESRGGRRVIEPSAAAENLSGMYEVETGNLLFAEAARAS